jgi:hypothetical protein
MNRKKSPVYIVFILILGSIIGTVLGKLVAAGIPEGSVVRKFFLVAANWGVQPFTVDLGIFSITLGFTLELNVIGVLGIVFTAYLLRYYLNY